MVEGAAAELRCRICRAPARLADNPYFGTGLSVPTLGEGEGYEQLLADRASYEEYDASAHFGGHGYGFVRLQQLALEHLMGARH